LLAYRSDIDGLRAIAILSVVLFHAGFPYLPGGFVGVDIFFVISGYLITLWIKNNLADNTFSFRKFYLNRLRRLAPSFFVVLAFICTAGFFLEGAEGLVSLAKTLASSLAFTSNWFFLNQASYFDPALETNALLHTWSLSVEEQFYLAWPLVLFALRHNLDGTSRKLVDVVFILFAVSLLAGVLLAEKSLAQQAFFNSAGRIWELLSGASLAIGLVEFPNKKSIATGMRCLGLGLIIFSIGCYSRKTSYPGFAALAPVIGSFFVIAASPNFRDPIFNILSSAPFRFVGKISYSLYLWHWPLLVFARSLNPQLSIPALLTILMAAFLLATVSTFLFEIPIRQRRLFRNDKPFLATAGLLFVIFMGLGIFTVKSNGLPDRWQETTISENPDDIATGFDRGHCFIEDEPLEHLTNTCLAPDPSKKNILVIGDSFAAHLMPGLKHYFPDYHFVQATAASCRALVNFTYGRYRCTELNRLLFSETIMDKKYDAIFLMADWVYGDRMTDTLATIRARTATPIVVFGNTPAYTSNPSDSMKRHVMTGIPMKLTPPPFRDFLWETNEEIKKSSAGKARFISLLENFCPNKVCPLITDGDKNVHFDWGHVTGWGSIAVIGASRDQIADALPRH